jgi:hypothetical protein
MKPKKQDRQESEMAQRIGNPMCPRLMSLKEASAYSGLKLWTLRERIWAGDLPFIQWPGGKKQFIDRNDLEMWISRNKKVLN